MLPIENAKISNIYHNASCLSACGVYISLLSKSRKIAICHYEEHVNCTHEIITFKSRLHQGKLACKRTRPKNAILLGVVSLSVKSFNLVGFCSISGYAESIEFFCVGREMPRQFRLGGGRGRTEKSDQLYF